MNEPPDGPSAHDLELRLTGLLYARAILEQRGASTLELDALSREAAYVRWRIEHPDYDVAA